MEYMLATVDHAKKAIGQRLKSVLDREGITLYRAAKLLGVDKTAPGKAVKNGPSLKLLIGVASNPAFNTTLGELVGVPEARAGEAPLSGSITDTGKLKSPVFEARMLKATAPSPREWVKAPAGCESAFAVQVESPATLADFPGLSLDEGDVLVFSKGVRWLTHGRVVVVTRTSPIDWSARVGVYFNAFRKEGVIPLYGDDAKPLDFDDGWKKGRPFPWGRLRRRPLRLRGRAVRVVRCDFLCTYAYAVVVEPREIVLAVMES